MAKEALILLVKYPRLGKTKTRLAPALGETLAARISEAFLLDLLNRFGPRTELRTVIVGSARDSEEEFRSFLEGRGVEAPGLEVFLPRTGSIEGDMATGYAHVLADSPKAILTAPDIPYLSVRMVGDMLSALDTCDLVFCPNPDGTALPHGMKGPLNLFDPGNTRSADWLGQWFRRIKSQGLSYKMFPMAFDIDRIEDLTMFYNWQLILEDSADEDLLCPATLKLLKSIL